MNGSRKIFTPSRDSISVTLPPSKSYTNRALITSALAEGTSLIRNPSTSTDTRLLQYALGVFGIGIEPGDDGLSVRGCGGRIRKPGGVLHLGNAGTAMRFLASFASLAPGETTLTGDEDMLRRPIGDLVDALRLAGADIDCRDGYPPVRIRGGTLQGGRIPVKSAKSSQYISSMLLVAPYTASGLTIEPDVPPSSRPYIGMTLHVMRHFGSSVHESGGSFRVEKADRYCTREFTVEPDLSSATYFAAAAAISGVGVTLQNVPPSTLQGDLRFFSVIEKMGCTSGMVGNDMKIGGGILRPLDEEMNDIPDSVPAVSLMSAFAPGPSMLRNVGQLRFKETDRLTVLAAELRKIGAHARVDGDDFSITPGPLRPAVIDPHNDHRIAMSFAAAGLALPGTTILDPGCVGKSFPGFWGEFEKFYSNGGSHHVG